MKNFFIIIGIMLLASRQCLFAQQDIQLSQYVFNGLGINPAYAGYKEDLYFNSIYRQQWVNFPGAAKTGLVSLDGLAKASDKQIGLGGQIAWDEVGPQTTLSLMGSFAYRIKLNDADTKRLCIGVGFGATQYALDGNSLVYFDAGEAEIPTGKVSAIKPDARLGVYYYTPSFYAGASMLDLFSLFQNQIVYATNGTILAAIQKAPHIYLTAGGMINLSDEIKLKPSFILKEDFHGPTSVDLNVFALLSERLWVGASYRSAVNIWSKTDLQTGLDKNGACSAMLELFATQKLRIGYSYDFITSGLASYQSGSHELSIGLLIPNTRDMGRIKSPRYF